MKIHHLVAVCLVCGAATALAGPNSPARVHAFAKLPDWSGVWLSVAWPLDATDTTGQVALINGLGNTFALELDTDTAGTHKWTGSGILVGIDPKSDAKDVNQVAFAFDGTGVLTFA